MDKATQDLPKLGDLQVLHHRETTRDQSTNVPDSPWALMYSISIWGLTENVVAKHVQKGDV